MLFLAYLLLGAFIFYRIESPPERERIRVAKEERKEINSKNDNDNHFLCIDYLARKSRRL